MHIRITDKSYVPWWRTFDGIGRLFWLLMIPFSFFMLFILIAILIMAINAGDEFSISDIELFVVLIGCNVFLIGLMVRGRHIPEQYGSVIFGEDILCLNRVFPFRNFRFKCSYEKVSKIHIGHCPRKYCRWASSTNGIATEEDILLMSRHYGDSYIVASDEEEHELFGLTYNGDAWRLLLEKCPDAKVFMSQDEYDDYCQEEKRRANAFEEEMKKKSGMQSFDGYIN